MRNTADALSARRAADLQKLKDLSLNSKGVFSIISYNGRPISSISLMFKIKTPKSTSYPKEFARESNAMVSLSSRYPLEPPIIQFSTPIFNPNVYASGKVCLGSKWLPTEFLDLLVYRVMKLLSYDETIINTNSPANHEASRWYVSIIKKYPNIFPTIDLNSIFNQRLRPTITWNSVR